MNSPSVRVALSAVPFLVFDVEVASCDVGFVAIDEVCDVVSLKLGTVWSMRARNVRASM